MLHPVLLLYLVATAYLLSIYPLGLCMPGYLQWGRMLGYATPAFILIFIYLIGLMADSNMAHVYTARRSTSRPPTTASKTATSAPSATTARHTRRPTSATLTC